jgi:hypothetical protein
MRHWLCLVNGTKAAGFPLLVTDPPARFLSSSSARERAATGRNPRPVTGIIGPRFAPGRGRSVPAGLPVRSRTHTTTSLPNAALKPTPCAVPGRCVLVRRPLSGPPLGSRWGCPPALRAGATAGVCSPWAPHRAPLFPSHVRRMLTGWPERRTCSLGLVVRAKETLHSAHRGLKAGRALPEERRWSPGPPIPRTRKRSASRSGRPLLHLDGKERRPSFIALGGSGARPQVGFAS